MARRRAGALVALVLHCASASARVAPPLPVIGDTLDCRAALLLAVRAHVPTLFETGAEYDVDMLEFLAENRKLATYLDAHPIYAAEAAHRQAPFDLEIHWTPTPRTAEQTAAAADKSSVPAPMATLVAQRVAASRTDGGREALVADTLGASVALGSARFWNALLGVALQLPSDRRAKVMSAPSPAEAIDALFRPGDLNWERFQRTFRFAAHHWSPADFVGLEDVRDRLVQIAAQETSLVVAALASAVVLQGGDSTVETARSAWLDGTMEKHPELRHVPPDAMAILRNQLATTLGARAGRKASSVRTLRAVEVPPILASFRGIPGGDCSTKMCFAYGYLPRERTFFLEDGHDEPLGYAMFTHVETPGDDGRPVERWYLHDVTGNRLSPKLLEVFVAGFTKAARLRGGDVVLPTAKRIEAMNNHRALITAFQALTVGGTAVPIIYPDRELRDGLRASGVDVDLRYDVSKSNPDAISPVLPASLLASVEAAFAEPRVAEVGSSEPPAPPVAVLLALDLLTGARLAHARVTLTADVARIAAGGIATGSIDYRPRRAAATSLLKSRNVPLAEVDALNDALQNPQALPLAAYYDDVDRRFRALGVEAPENLRESRPYLFYEGHLAAPDRLTSEDAALRRLTVLYAVTLMRRWPNPTLAFGAVAEAPEIFSESERFRNAVRSWLGRDGESSDKLRAIARLPIDFSFLVEEERAVLAAALAP